MMAEPPTGWASDWLDETGKYVYNEQNQLHSRYVNGEFEGFYDSGEISLETAVVSAKTEGFTASALRAYEKSYNPDYSPYNADAVTMGVSVNLGYFGQGMTYEFGLAFQGGDIGLYLSSGASVSAPVNINPLKTLPSFGFNFGFHDRKDGNDNLNTFSSLAGNSINYYGDIGILGYTQSHSLDKNTFKITKDGMISNTFTFGDGKIAGFGIGSSVTQTNILSLKNLKIYN